MKVLNFTRPENGADKDPLYYLGFEEFQDSVRDCYLFMADLGKDLFSDRYDDKEKLVLTLEEPNFCTSDSYHVNMHEHCSHIYTLCPYVSKINPQRTFVFFPFNEKFIPNDMQKEIDIVYFGGWVGFAPWRQYLEELSKRHNVRHGHYSYGTDINVPYEKKIEMYAQSRISIVHGLCNVSKEHVGKYRAFPGAGNNPAMSHLDQGAIPQIKSRMFEAAFCKSLILCQRDPWNVIEHVFEPNKDFLYFNDLNDLIQIVSEVLKNYDFYYDTIVQNAFNKAISNYTTRHFVAKYLR